MTEKNSMTIHLDNLAFSEFDIGQGKARKIVVCLWSAKCSCDSHEINSLSSTVK